MGKEDEVVDFNDLIGKITQANCKDILKELPDKCVDLVLTDPPYGVGLTAKQHKWFHSNGDGYDGSDDTEENIINNIVPRIKLSIQKSKRSIISPGIRNIFKYPEPDDMGCIFNSAGTGSGRWGFNCFNPILYYGKCPYISSGKGGRPNSWQQPANDYADKNGHPCPKPLGMWEWLLNRGSMPGDLILDPFAGSGTTAIACHRLGRRFICIEKEPKYCEIARRRLAEAQAQGELFQ